MYFLFLTLLLCANGIAKANDLKYELPETNNLTVYDVYNRVLSHMKFDDEKRIELKSKLDRINHYVVNYNVMADILKNVTAETKLNETNFYEALNENDHFTYLTNNGTKNLYLKLKEKMTRDDIMKIVAEKGKRSKLVKSARRMMENNLAKHDDDEKMNDVVDKLLAEVPNDQHKKTAKESVYWDPQGELEEMKNYQESKRSGRRIFKGERTTIQYYPFMASVHLMGRFWCGAVLIWSDLCITSASCLQLLHNNRFFRENPRILQVRIGSNHSRVGGEMIDVLEVFFHPGYNPRTLKNNLAVLRLRRHLFLRRKTLIKYLAIDYKSHGVPPTAEVLLLGWGVTKMSQKLSFEPIYLQRKILPVYPNYFCKEVYGEKFISDTMFCAGTLTTGEGACDHDAGGPAILSGRLVGIISFGPTVCGFADAPTVFTKIGFFSDWIEVINETMPSYYTGKARTTTTTRSRLKSYLATYKIGQTSTLIDPFSKYPETDDEETTADVEETTIEPFTTTDVTRDTEDTTPDTTLVTTTSRTPALRLKGGRVSDEDWSVNSS